MSSHIRNKLNKQKYNQTHNAIGTTVYNKYAKTITDNRYISSNPNVLNYSQGGNHKKGTINPLMGNRKELSCCSISKPLYQSIYKDNYSNCNGGLCKKPIIRSGMQHKTIAENFFTRDTQKKEIEKLTNDLNNAAKDVDIALIQEQLLEQNRILNAGYKHIKTEYSYSYREYMKNKKNITYTRRQQTFNKTTPETDNLWTSGTWNCDNNKCNKTTWKPNNDKFKVQGAVSSSTRLDRLKLDAIRGGSRCTKEPTKCNGVYFAGKPRFTGWIFNDTHKEINFPQIHARRRTFSMWNNKEKQNKNVRIYNKNDCDC